MPPKFPSQNISSEAAFQGLWKACTDAIEHLNRLQGQVDLLTSRLRRLEQEMLEAVEELHYRMDVLSANPVDVGALAPEQTDLCLHSMD